ncbi:pyridoxal 5'-phosphate synthase [Streptomyces sp. SL13]|uniref:Pyridoxal 5'-phosphate synthase n=1 Tax=Streptantibioticus silvisoli TaxID=2705255 RepID=A0AA90K7U2_9ACTN|nr:pyridoxal 5'-phosphate synthase [Streptantibioticus silvisoli]MDI5962652.1 pyridoxal 5'-phosphate synthase [Streptantibioticus silvisoli]MDI5969283.1 pyridoxal 5'-phosphate synthase [Streptantibioticus silvisoli]
MTDDDRPDSGPVAALRGRLRHAPSAGVTLPDFDPDAAPAAPAPLVAEWLLRALDEHVPEPQVMTLGTVDAAGHASARVLLMRGLDDDADGCGFRFASDAASRKGRELTARPYASLTWYWPQQGRQIRAAGPVETLDAATARADFAHRGEASRVAAFTGTMSDPLDGPGQYARDRDRAARELAADPGAVPAGHTVYRLWATEVEFFQLAADRFHRRLRYTRTADRWERVQLWP